MAQATNPDYAQTTDDATMGEETGGKRSLFEKIKDKTLSKTTRATTKIKAKVQKTGGAEQTSADQDDEHSEEESEEPIRNAFDTGVTQPEYEHLLKKGATPSSSEGAQETAKPTNHFPGNFAGIVDDAPSQKLDESTLSKHFENLSTNDKQEEATPISTENVDEGVKESAENGKEESVEEGARNVTSTVADELPGTTQSQEGDELTSAEPTADGSALEGSTAKGPTTESGKSWTTWAAEKVGYVKDTTAAKMPTTEEGKPVHVDAYDKVNENVVQPSLEQGMKAKEAIVEKTAPASGQTDPAQQTYAQKASTGIYAMKDSIFSSTQPQDHDKALSQKVTDSVSNLPATIKSSLGFGGASSPTTTSAVDQSPEVSEDGTEHQVPPQSPGLVSRFTSMFGSAPKKSADTDGTETTPGETTES